MMNFKFIIQLLVTSLFCIAANVVNASTDIDPDQRTCTEPLTQTLICIEDLDSIGESAMISDINTSFNCSIDILNDTCFTYQPLPGLVNVTDTIIAKACNYYTPDLCNERTVLVDIKEECDNYYNANDDESNNTLNEPVTINILKNDESDCALEDLVISLVTTSTNGAVVINVDRTITYTPNEQFTGQDNFDYKVCCLSVCDVATVMVNVSEEAHEPEVDMFANDDFYQIMLENENNFNVLSNDEINENETYDISIILEEENPYNT